MKKGSKTWCTIKIAEEAGGKFLGMSSVWNWHGISEIGGKRSQLLKDLKKLFAQNANIEKITVYVGCIGWSKHSKTELILINSSKSSEKDYSGWEFTREYIQRIGG